MGCMRNHAAQHVTRGSHDQRALHTHMEQTQNLVAKSSTEAELFASVRAACEALGLQTLMKESGMDTGARVYVDAAAAKSIRT